MELRGRGDRREDLMGVVGQVRGCSDISEVGM